MTLVYIGLGTTGLFAAIAAAQVIPTVKRWYRNDPYASRTERRVKTTIVQKGE
jgi:hypothetical protein